MKHLCEEYKIVDSGKWSEVFEIVEHDNQWFLWVGGIEGQDGEVPIKACPFCGETLGNRSQPKNLLEYVVAELSHIYEFKNIKETNPKWKMDVYKDGELVMKAFEVPKAVAMNQQNSIVKHAKDLFEKSIIVNEMMKRQE